MSKKLTFHCISGRDLSLHQWQRPPYSRAAPRSALECLS